MTPPADRQAAVTLGYVSRPNGLRGAVVIHTDPTMSDVFVPGLELELVPRTGPPLQTKLVSAAPVRGGLRVTLQHVSDRNHAEALVGATVRTSRDALGPMNEGEYLDTDLLGLEVLGSDGTRLGRLVEVIATGANDVYVARADDDTEILIPAVAHAIVGVDLEARTITVHSSALEYSAPSVAADK